MARFFLLAAALLPLEAWAMELTLVYRGQNHWVAEADNKALISLLREAAKGTTFYSAVLPSEGRRISIERLDVLKGLLEREAKRPVVIEEIDGAAKANTLVIRTR